MVRLYILRHAKAAVAQPGQKDFDRGLDERGQTDAPRIADAMREKGYLPQHILCSPAVRTRMTLHGVMGAYDDPPTIDYHESFYSGAPEDYWAALQGLEGGGDVMIVGHNPMCEIMAHEAAPKGDEHALALMRSKFPTGALAVIEFEATQWADARPGLGRLIEFLVPRGL